MSAYLRLDLRNAVKVGGTTLPGVLTSLSVSGILEVEQDKLEGSSSHVTSVEGYTTATVNLEITLHGDDASRERQLTTINTVFSASQPEGQANMGGYHWRVVNPHLNARRIRKMLFTRFDSRDDNEDDTTVVALEFKELLPEQARLEGRSGGGGAQASTNPVTGKQELPGIENQPTEPNPVDPPSTVPEPLRALAQGFKEAFGLVTDGTSASAAEIEAKRAIGNALIQHGPRITREQLEAAYPKGSGVNMDRLITQMIKEGSLREIEEGGQKFYTLGSDFDRLRPTTPARIPGRPL